MRPIKKPLVTGVLISSLLLTSLTGCGTSSASGDANDTSQEVSGDSSTSSENTFVFSKDCDMELTSTTIVGRVTGISDNTISLDIADLSEIEFSGPGQRPEDGSGDPDQRPESESNDPGQRPEGDGGSPAEGQAPDSDDSPSENGQAPDLSEPPEKPDDSENFSDGGQAPGGENRPGGKGFAFDLDSLTYVAGTLTIEDESMLLTASSRTLMSAFKDRDHQKGDMPNMGDSNSMPDLGSADNSSEESEEPISLSEIKEDDLVLITFDENGVITAIHVITDTEFLEQLESGGQPADLQEPDSRDQDSQESKSKEN